MANINDELINKAYEKYLEFAPRFGWFGLPYEEPILEVLGDNLSDSDIQLLVKRWRGFVVLVQGYPGLVSRVPVDGVIKLLENYSIVTPEALDILGSYVKLSENLTATNISTLYKLGTRSIKADKTKNNEGGKGFLTAVLNHPNISNELISHIVDERYYKRDIPMSYKFTKQQVDKMYDLVVDVDILQLENFMTIMDFLITRHLLDSERTANLLLSKAGVYLSPFNMNKVYLDKDVTHAVLNDKRCHSKITARYVIAKNNNFYLEDLLRLYQNKLYSWTLETKDQNGNIYNEFLDVVTRKITESLEFKRALVDLKINFLSLNETIEPRILQKVVNYMVNTVRENTLI